MQGKPRIVSQQYLGSADEVIAKLSETPAGQPVRSRHKRFGDLAAVWSMLVRLDLAGIVDEVFAAANAAATVGTYLALACANRGGGPVLLRLRRLVGDHGGWSARNDRAAVITAGSGMRWTGSARPNCARSRPGWDAGWSPSSPT